MFSFDQYAQVLQNHYKLNIRVEGEGYNRTRAIKPSHYLNQPNLQATSKVRRFSWKPCRKHKMYVDFAELSWDSYIIQPVGIQAFYCAGDCSAPLQASVNPTIHAILQSNVHSVKPGIVPAPCCVPIKLTGQSFLFITKNGDIVKKDYEKVVVKKCGCR